MSGAFSKSKNSARASFTATPRSPPCSSSMPFSKSCPPHRPLYTPASSGKKSVAISRSSHASPQFQISANRRPRHRCDLIAHVIARLSAKPARRPAQSSAHSKSVTAHESAAAPQPRQSRQPTKPRPPRHQSASQSGQAYQPPPIPRGQPRPPRHQPTASVSETSRLPPSLSLAPQRSRLSAAATIAAISATSICRVAPSSSSAASSHGLSHLFHSRANARHRLLATAGHPAYIYGYYDGYVVIYDPNTFFILNFVDLVS